MQVHYNTNLSKLVYKDNDAIELWKNFKNINIGASLDDSHARAEYIRKGTVWSEIEDNIKRIKTELPDIDFYVSATVDFFNAISIVNFYRYMVKNNFINIEDFQVNILFGNIYHNSNNQRIKNVALNKVRILLEELEGKDKLGRTTNGFQKRSPDEDKSLHTIL